MKRLVAAALVMTMSASGLAGMGLSSRRWKQFRTSGSFLGVFRDYRGARAAFFVEEKTGALIGPLDLDTPSGPGWILPPGAEPRELQVGDSAEVVFAGIVAVERPFGFPPAEDLSKNRVHRATKDPADGMFVSAVKREQRKATATHDPLALVLQGQVPPVTTDEDRHAAAVGWLLKHDAEHFRGPPELERLASVIFHGLSGIQGPYAPVAALWANGKKAEARALFRANKLQFFLQSDRWKRPSQPLESAPGEPLEGPFLRAGEWGDLDGTALFYLAPEFAQFLAD